VFRRIAGLMDANPWWITQRSGDMYAETPSAIDGIARTPFALGPLRAPSAAIAENMRRASDVTVSLTVAGATFETSIGPVVFPYADAQLGLQLRPVAGAPDVAMRLGRALEWVPADRSITRPMRVRLQSFSDREHTLTLRVVSPPGVRVDSVPPRVRVNPREQRQIVLSMRARMDTGKKKTFGVIAARPMREPSVTGYQVTQLPHLLPIRIARQSGLWLQPVEITVPRRLAVVYVSGIADVIPAALRDVGVSVAAVPAEELHAVNLAEVSTVVFGPRAVELHTELVAQMPRLMEFVSDGGTLVIQRGERGTMESALFPYFVEAARPAAERVTDPKALIRVIYPNSSVLRWPNRVHDADWENWVGERTTFVPTRVDPRYERILETHDRGQPDNRNSLLVARIGRGVFIYTSLTLDEQIAAGVPGGLRLLVNLMSAGLAPRAVQRP
jgi:hypothetical protein